MTTKPTSQLNFEVRGNITVGTIQASNMFDAMNVAEFGNEAIKYLEDKPGTKLLLNFESVDYMSSAALTELLRINEEVKKTDGSVRLCSLTPDIRKVFEITNLEKLFVIHDDDSLESALKRYERSLTVASDDATWAGSDEGS